MSEKSLSKNTRKNVILLHIAVMCFSFSGVIGQYVQADQSDQHGQKLANGQT